MKPFRIYVKLWMNFIIKGLERAIRCIVRLDHMTLLVWDGECVRGLSSIIGKEKPWKGMIMNT
ncbi:hypothetical protein IEQ34_005692 [Dendrobium chrysotoxum]|uniref:Uncharacterized protein n=1 Tax=Dendrobium chrysotoxum TaxID=161865 RepID=A0AAV7HCY1_DENCH|nr:hypothetical protein IEQ34_005692 [Dendrobium chrysotoxum]